MDTQTIEEGFQRVWQMFQETDKKFQETDKKFKETDKRISELSSKWGRFVEGIVFPGITDLFASRGIEIETLSQRVRSRKGGEEMEIDILGTNAEYAIPVEVKSTLGTGDVSEFLEDLKRFRHFFPEYADRKIIGVVAAIVMDSDADKFAYRQGLFVIGQKGDNIIFLNDDKFVPKTF